ncbi:tyrosine-type recombinase/integrase [Xanthomonas citri]|uniref:tyrosine-type recombinase/integrase n=3 Tax=Xanthomonas citri TaxID=346 RepID=UPI000C07A9F3|nr:integrase arm-type DNA-binding domain-containing protein [Xanthomonas citri]MCT8357470.1 integrase arm-type DNA-binding domain-containing protein [Xanthomonas citri pv. anacardii]MCT8361550.1 integrase arm-type DNA-binding domain-containing protein [Xanthomonas citri pv. anacardii]MCT8366450.1 integrase arm-type DNA-binding domain-containing protein [Xanthomonas citri pv. anacardii]MCT8369494.1 integrase arm-type DNA-binding domain-containing protein [Xanthomonas citri pv. anacardii]MCT8373
MPLSDAAVRNAKPAAKPVRLFDGGGLYVEISPKGAKLWRWKYRFGGKEKRLALGVYPEIGLADARAQHLEARKVLRSGVDPADKRRVDKLVRADRSQLSFAVVAAELLELHAKKNSPLTMKRNARIVEKDLNPYLGHRPVAEVSAPELLAVLRKIEARGAVETAHRARGIASMVFRYAITVGKAERDPASDLFGALETPKVQNFASLTEPTEVAPLLRALWGYEGSPVVRAALKLAPLVFARPGELRSAKWKDIDLVAGEWRYVASKTGTPHIVPLASQAVEVLRELEPITRNSEFVFPSLHGKGRSMSDSTINAALRRMGFDSKTMTGHGFRAMARTILDEVLGFRPDYIEHQLAHAVRDPNGRAYNRTAHIAERRKMMQAWADYLDGLRIQQHKS